MYFSKKSVDELYTSRKNFVMYDSHFDILDCYLD